MKAKQRNIYLKLTNLDNPLHWSGLCLFCKYAYWTGSDCTEDAEVNCKHQIEEIVEHCWDTWEGSDCWAFRPAYPLNDVVDAVGLILQGLHPDMSEVA